MPGSLITVTGLADVQAFISGAPKGIVASGFVKALSAAANVFAGEVERNCPVKKEDVGGLLDKGELRELLQVQVIIDSQFRGGVGLCGWPITARLPKNLPLWVERGHRLVMRGGYYTDNRGRRRKGTHVANVPPHPFVAPSFDRVWPQALEAFTKEISSAVQQYQQSGGSVTLSIP